MNHHNYLFALVDGGGNVPPEVSAARRLVGRGHSVTILAEDSIALDVRSSGAVFRRWEHAPNRPDRKPGNDPSRDWECKYPWQLVHRLNETLIVGPAERYARDVSAAIETSPDLVVCSMFCVGAMIAAEKAGVPFDVLFTTIYPLPAEGITPFGMGLRPARTFIGRWRDRSLNLLAERLWDSGLTTLNALRRAYGLSPVAHAFDQLRGARRQLVQTSADFDFPWTPPPNVRYVGPVLDDPTWAEDTSWTPPRGPNPLVLVAMSSTYQDQIASLQRVIDALGTLPVQAVVTTGPALDSSALHARANVTIVRSAPHRQVLQHAALVVTHGGHGTVIKALAAGVPMVVLPHGRDQADTAARVDARGAGLALKRSAGSAAIADAVRRILRDDSYRIAARRLGQTVCRDARSDALIRELEDIPDIQGRAS
ncbi:MAG TPA: glycosyltransferase [Vicinamibacterales bacterium]|nr:glycosyltransferase [Vicinamibacterales bacterium]